jgi:outer membrane protein assembly factor BamB
MKEGLLTPRRIRSRWLLLVGMFLATACQEADLTEPEVPAPSVVGVEVRPAERVLSVIGVTDRLGALEVWSDGSRAGGSRVYPDLYRWESEDPNVAAVDQFGVVTSVGEGTTRIRALRGDWVGTSEVIVREVVREAWSFRLNDLPGAITVGEDGTVYAADFGTIHTLAPGGAVLGGIFTGGEVGSAPAIGPDGTLYVGSNGGDAFLMAVGRGGSRHWALDGNASVGASPALGPDGTVYAGSRDGVSSGTLRAVDQSGRTKWDFEGLFALSSPALADDGTVLVGTETGGFYAFNPDGTQRWFFLTGGAIRSSAAIGRDGSIYFTSNDQHLYALTPDGALRWRVPASLNDSGSSPAIGTDGTIFIGGQGLRAFDPSGQLLWMYPGTNPLSGTHGFGSPIVGADGTIYSAGSRSLFAVRPDGTLKWDYPLGWRVYSQPVIGLDGQILTASYDSTLVGTVHAIVELEGSSGGFESAAWPKARGDRANTGRAGGP